jgi:glutathione synthase/RimK-type ligase-like ATP-grasp enzyme
VTARVALATCAVFPELGEDDPLLLERLRGLGIDADPAVWDDPAVDWGGFDLVVIRSTWDYSLRRDEFLAWTRAVPRILNPPDVVAWNTDKRYLSTLEHAVPTRYLDPGDELDAPEGEYVVKPAISAGSKDTARYGPGDHEAAAAHARRLLADDRVVMVQPYLGEVDSHGETAVIHIGGAYSHAIRKGQLLHRGVAPSDGIFLEENISAREPDEAELRVAAETLDSLPWPRGDLLYARVDMIRAADGTPRVVELELTEPSLFISFADGAVDRLAREIVANT